MTEGTLAVRSSKRFISPHAIYQEVSCRPQSVLAIAFLIPDSAKWRFQANDDSPGDWLVTGIYAALMVLSWRAALRSKPAERASGRALQRSFWIWLAMGITAVGINKQLDLQVLMVELGRQAAQAEGLLPYRRFIQAGFAGTAAVGAAAITVALWLLSRRASASERLVIIGVCALLGFVVLRIAGFNHIDFLNQGMQEHGRMLVLELALSTFLCFAVWRNHQTEPSRSSTR